MATKFCKIFTLLLSYIVPVKSKVKISQNFVAFSEYMNFKYATQILFLTYLYTTDSWHNHPMLNSYVGVALMRCLSCQNKYVTLTEKLHIRKFVLCTLKLSNYNALFGEGAVLIVPILPKGTDSFYCLQLTPGYHTLCKFMLPLL